MSIKTTEALLLPFPPTTRRPMKNINITCPLDSSLPFSLVQMTSAVQFSSTLVCAHKHNKTKSSNQCIFCSCFCEKIKHTRRKKMGRVFFVSLHDKTTRHHYNFLHNNHQSTINNKQNKYTSIQKNTEYLSEGSVISVLKQKKTKFLSMDESLSNNFSPKRSLKDP